MPEYIELRGAEATEALGARLAGALPPSDSAPVHVFLHGELGAGKTTLTRGLLRGLGHRGRVPSPTYTLVEPYEAGGRRVFHLDLYRLDPGAPLDDLGLEEMAEPGSVLLIEWPERGAARYFAPDLDVTLDISPPGRRCRIDAHGAAGAVLLRRLLAAQA